jgi:hypothetical protein
MELGSPPLGLLGTAIERGLSPAGRLDLHDQAAGRTGPRVQRALMRGDDGADDGQAQAYAAAVSISTRFGTGTSPRGRRGAVLVRGLTPP